MRPVAVQMGACAHSSSESAAKLTSRAAAWLSPLKFASLTREGTSDPSLCAFPRAGPRASFCAELDAVHAACRTAVPSLGRGLAQQARAQARQGLNADEARGGWLDATRAPVRTGLRVGMSNRRGGAAVAPAAGEAAHVGK